MCHSFFLLEHTFLLSKRNTMEYKPAMPRKKAPTKAKPMISETFVRARLPRPLLVQVDELAEARFTTRSEVLRQAIREYVERHL